MRILVIDDEIAIREVIKEILEEEGYEVALASDGRLAMKQLRRYDDDTALILCDVKMPRMDGWEVLKKVREHYPDIPVIMISGHATSAEDAMQAVRLGAYDYLTKPLDHNKLILAVRNALERRHLIQETRRLKRQVQQQALRPLLGESPAMQQLKEQIEKVAPLDVRVLILGENGTGKELVARWIHHLSKRNDKPFVALNCAAIPSELIESELFGHEKGAFTSAIKQRIGKFEEANEGTLFLDEIGDMSLAAQAKVLRALQEGVITRVGSNEEIPVNVRIIAATNKDLALEIQQGRFREDLYHRLSVVVLKVPPLRERKEDIPLLANTFLKESLQAYGLPPKSFDKKALEFLQQQPWSGNVRELQNVVERLAIFAQNPITAEEVKKYLMPLPQQALIYDLVKQFKHLKDFKETLEKYFITYYLKQFKGDKQQTAKAIGISQEELENLIQRYQIHPVSL